jgi:hypothetical protein
MQYNQNGDKFFYNIVVSNNSSYTDTNVVTTITPLPAGIVFDHVEYTQGSFNSTTLTWTIPSMPGKTTTSLRLWVEVTNTTLGPFSITYTSTGTLVDPNLADNTNTLTASLSGCAPDAGGVEDFTSCLCINVAENDTACTFGTTEYRLNAGSVVNGVVQDWDVITGVGNFTAIDPTLSITGTYDVWCIVGVDEYQKSCGVDFTIYPQLDDKDIFDHTISTVQYSALSPADIAVLSAQYPSVTMADFCWRVLRNADGDATSGEPVICDDSVDTKTLFFCSDIDCNTPEEPCPCPTDSCPVDVVAQFPVDYEPEIGDTVVVYHPNAMSVWVYDGTNFNKWSCGCIYKISQDANNDLSLGSDNAPFFDLSAMTEIVELQDKVVTGISFTGTTTKTLTLTFDDGSTITANFTDLQGSGGTYVSVSDTCSVNMSISGTGTIVDPFVISAVYNDGGPIYDYNSGVLGSTGNTLNVSTLFGMPCPAGCTAVYTLNGYPADVYENVTLVGSTLTYDIKANAPSGTHDINIQRECTTLS